MKTRNLFTLLLLWLTAAGAWAQNTIVVCQNDGTMARFAFTENPRVTYSASELVMTTNKTSVQYPINRLMKIYFDVDENSNGIKDVEASQPEDVQFSFRDGALVVSGGKITLYSKATLPKHFGAEYDDNDYIQWHYYHCECWVDCRIDGNKIRVPEGEWDKCGGYNVPLVQMNNNAPVIYESEATIIGDAPKGRKAGDKIELKCWVPLGFTINSKSIEAKYTYEWRE